MCNYNQCGGGGLCKLPSLGSLFPQSIWIDAPAVSPLSSTDLSVGLKLFLNINNVCN